MRPPLMTAVLAAMLCAPTINCRRSKEESPNSLFRSARRCSLADALKPVPASELPPHPQEKPRPDEIAELRWAKVYFTGEAWDRTPVLVTCHSSDTWGHTVRFYAKKGQTLLPQHEEGFGWGHLADPMYFAHKGHAFMLLRNNSGGSSSCWDHRCVHLGKLRSAGTAWQEVHKVAIESPVVNRGRTGAVMVSEALRG